MKNGTRAHPRCLVAACYLLLTAAVVAFIITARLVHNTSNPLAAYIEAMSSAEARLQLLAFTGTSTTAALDEAATAALARSSATADYTNSPALLVTASTRVTGNEDVPWPGPGDAKIPTSKQASFGVSDSPLRNHQENYSGYRPLPWRALDHLSSPQPEDSAARTPRHSPAYLVSAFLDTRGQLQGKAVRAALIMALHKQTNTQNWLCVFELRDAVNPDTTLQQVTSALTVAYVVPNNEAFFDYQAVTAHCKIPEDMNVAELLDPEGHQPSSRQLHVTVIGSAQLTKGNDYSRHNSNTTKIDLRYVRPVSWVQVTIIPPVKSIKAHTDSSNGTFAVCTPPLHTDAYAATLLEWTEFVKLMGGTRVYIYAFNPGPMIKPLIDYYQATGFFNVHEWIIPKSILQNPSQRCRLPFFQSSSSRDDYDSPDCTFHQDNYNIAWWGQVLAIQDCVYRAMAAQHRWVTITDFDEYIVPQKASAPNWSAMMNQLSQLNGGHPAMEYRFQGVKLCSGCMRHLPPVNNTSNSLTAHTNSIHNPTRSVAEADQKQSDQSAVSGEPADLSDLCISPSLGFKHILWSPAMVGSRDHMKSIVDPLSVGQASVHSTAHFSPFSPTGGIVMVPADVAVKLHDRVHDIHVPITFATDMLPKLLVHVQQGMGAEWDSAKVSAPGHIVSFDKAQRWDAADELCDSCTGFSASAAREHHMKHGFCLLHGKSLSQSIDDALHSMQQAGVFAVWQQLPVNASNVYGGHKFDAWAPRR